MKKITRLATVLAAFAMLFALAVPASAQSAQAGVLVFTGTAVVKPALGLPPSSAQGTWSFDVNNPNAGANSNCVEVHAWFELVPPDGGGEVGVDCLLHADGDLGPNALGVGASCGMSEGTQGSGTANYTGVGGSLDLTNYGWITSAGGTIPFTGDIVGGGVFVSLVQAQGGAGCIDGTAGEFAVVGVGAAVVV